MKNPGVRSVIQNRDSLRKRMHNVLFWQISLKAGFASQTCPCETGTDIKRRGFFRTIKSVSSG